MYEAGSTRERNMEAKGVGEAKNQADQSTDSWFGNRLAESSAAVRIEG